MEFKDFENCHHDLIGKTVQYTSGLSYSNSRRKSLLTIESVNKAGFRLSTMPDKLFSLTTGKEKGLSGKMDAYLVSYCTLLSEDEVTALRDSWMQTNNIKAVRAEIISLIHDLDLKSLREIETFIHTFKKTNNHEDITINT